MIAINPFDPLTLLLIACLNPSTIIVAALMGRAADQWQKLPVAAFAAAMSGFFLYWVAAFLGFFSVHAVGGEAAILTMSFFFGLAWAILGFILSPSRK